MFNDDGFGWSGMGDPMPGGPWHPAWGALASGVGTGTTIAIEEMATASPKLQKWAESIGLAADLALAIGASFYGPARAAAVTLAAASFANHAPRQVQKYLAASTAVEGSRGVGTTYAVPTRRLGTPAFVPTYAAGRRGLGAGARPRLLAAAQATGGGGGRSNEFRIVQPAIAPNHFGYSIASAR